MWLLLVVDPRREKLSCFFVLVKAQSWLIDILKTDTASIDIMDNRELSMAWNLISANRIADFTKLVVFLFI